MTSDIEIDADEMEAIGDEIEPPTTMDWVHNYVAQHGHLRSIELGRAKLSGIDLSGIDMRNSVIRGSIDHANLRAANLSGTYSSANKMMGIDLRDADCRNMDLSFSDCRHADFRGADLRHTDMQHVRIEFARFEGARMDGVTMRDAEGIHLASFDGGTLHALYDAHRLVPSTGRFHAWFPIPLNHMAIVAIPWDARRVCGLSNRTGRASAIEIVAIYDMDGTPHDWAERDPMNCFPTRYRVGDRLEAESFDPHPGIKYADTAYHGIAFFPTLKDAMIVGGMHTRDLTDADLNRR